MTVVLSYGMGVDSTAILLRWLEDPSSRDFPLSDLIVLTAMTGDEFVETGQLVETHILPRLRTQGIRFVQIARRSARQADGVATLSDSHAPHNVYLGGDGWRLSDELLTAGTVPQVATGKRLCTQHFKGWPLDTWLEASFGDLPFRHVIGYNADEGKRQRRDEGYAGESATLNRQPEYPLFEWGWGRQACEDYIESIVGVAWPKSCCTFCPFAKDNHLDRYRENPDAAVQAMLIEHTSLALNPRSTLFAKASVIQLVERSGNTEATEAFYHELARSDYALYEIRRAFFAKGGDPTKKGPSARSVRTLATGPHVRVTAPMRALAARFGTRPFVDDHGIERVTILDREDTYPTIEHFLVVAPAGVADKQRAGFEKSWARLTAERQYRRRLSA